MKVTIAIPTYNRCEMLGPSLDSISQAAIPPCIHSLRIVVIDNNCTDDTAKVVAERKKTSAMELTHVIEAQQGLCFGRNRAIQEAEGSDYCVFLDDDIVLHRNWLIGLSEAVSKFGCDCVVGPVFAKFSSPMPPFMTKKAIRSLSSMYSQKGDEAFVLPESAAHEIPGCNFAVSVAAAKEVSGFDNRLDRIGKGLLSGGDFDFGRRLARAGKKVAYHPHCAIDHVIISEKISEQYIRRRWRGKGATKRAMFPFRNSILDRLKYFAGSTKLYLKWRSLQWLGKRHDAFDVLLEIEKMHGFRAGC